jgi:TP901 family phage tail tape measure protein
MSLMGARTMEARAIISAQDRTGRVFQQVAGKMRALDHQARAVSQSMVASNGMLAASARALAPLLAPVAIGYGIKTLAGESLSLERTMIQVQKATNASGADLKAYEQNILDLARETGKSKEEIGSIMAAAAFAGRPLEDLARYTAFAAKATSAWGTNAEETGQALAELGNIYKASQGRLEEIGDAINHVADNAAASEKDLVEFLRRSGAVGNQAGLTAEQTIAFGAAMKEVGVGTEVAATTFNTLMNAMALGNEFLDDSKEGFKALGINAAKVQKEFAKKPLETTVKLLERISKIKDPIKRSQVLTDLFGKEYQDNIAILAGNLGGLEKALGLVGNKGAYAGSIMQGFQKAMDTDVGRIERATQALDVLATRSGNAFKVMAGSAAEEINRFVDSVEKGDTSVQRLLTYYNELQKGRDGTNDIQSPAEDLNRWAEENWGRFTPRALFDEYFGRTGAEARAKGQSAAIAEDVARENEALAREARAQRARDEAQRRLTGGPLLPSERRRFELERGRAEDELRAAAPAATEIRRTRAALPGQVADLERRVASGDRLMSFARPPSEPVFQAGPGLLSFAPNRSGMALTGGLTGKAEAVVSQPVDVTGKVEAVLSQPIDLTGKVEAVVTQPVDVTGKVEAEIVGQATVNVRVQVEGGGRVVGMGAESTGNIRANLGTSMPHIKAGPR